MKLVVFGLAVSSSWGNGHATLWRGLARALGRRGHMVVFFERNVAYYAANRDFTQLAGGELVLYDSWEAIQRHVNRHLADADAAIITSYCPDAIPATHLVIDSRVPVKAFYDLDTGVTLRRLQQGLPVPYIGSRGLRDFDLVLSYVGGPALAALKTQLQARRVAPLYGCVDPAVHRPVQPVERYRSDLSYLGTFAEDRQAKLERLLIEPARRLPELRFMMGGALYPDSFPWSSNIYFVYHVRPSEHAAFYSSSRLTLNVTRRSMARFGYCPSARLFEAAACGVPVVTDEWQGLDEFFAPGDEILVARTAQDVVDALKRPGAELARIGESARARTLEEHTAERRASELEGLIDSAHQLYSQVQHRNVERCCLS